MESEERAGGAEQNVWRNVFTIVGAWIAGTAILFILTLLGFDFLTPNPSPYIGLFTFLVIPGFVVLGLGLMLGGLLWKRQILQRQHGSLSRLRYYPRIDFNLPQHRRAIVGVLAAGLATLPFVGVMSYHGYHYTDSNEFCGGVCHSVMSPQYMAHEVSPHARVGCAECHIGRGASWYVKSKLSGVRQVVAVTTDSFPRPIPPAISELRPARETCERCHWPEKFYGDQLLTKHHFANDERSTPRAVRLLVKTGGSDPTTGPPSGIHWHMALSHRIEFVATDEEYQIIPWVRSINEITGESVVYRNDGLTSKDPPPPGHPRTIDCMDCHNRATHVFRSPAQAADDALVAQPELRELPFARREIVNAVLAGMGGPAQEPQKVVEAARLFYEKNYPEVAKSKKSHVEALAEVARDINSISFFPGMKVDWTTYPNNIGHMEFRGCFRCHAGDHKDDSGKVLTHECHTCHDFLVPPADGSDSLVRRNTFVHPVELEGLHAALRCDECHGGGLTPEPSCGGCHHEVAALRQGTTAALQRFGIEADVMNDVVDCANCHDLSRRVSAEWVQTQCSACHSEDEYSGMVKRWEGEVKELLAAVRSDSPDVRAAVDLLVRSGPMHNMEAVRNVLKALASEPSPAAETTASAR